MLKFKRTYGLVWWTRRFRLVNFSPHICTTQNLPVTIFLFSGSCTCCIRCPWTRPRICRLKPSCLILIVFHTILDLTREWPLTRNDHVALFSGPKVYGRWKRFGVTLQLNILPDVATHQLIRNGQHRWNCNTRQENEQINLFLF